MNSGTCQIGTNAETGEFGGIMLNATFKFDEDYDDFLISHRDWLEIADELSSELGQSFIN